MGDLTGLRPQELTQLAYRLKVPKETISVQAVIHGLASYLQINFSSRAIQDAIRVLKANGLITPSIAEANEALLGHKPKSCPLVIGKTIANGGSGSYAPGACKLELNHAGPCVSKDNLVSEALKKHTPKGPISQDLQAAFEKFSYQNYPADFEKQNFDTGEFEQTIKQKTLALFDETWAAHESDLQVGLLELINERFEGLKIEAAGPMAQTVFSLSLPELPKAINFARRPHVMFPKVVALVRAGLNVLLVGPAGSGKTTIAEDVARAYEREMATVNCTGALSEGLLTGKLYPIGAGGSNVYLASGAVMRFCGERNVWEEGAVRVIKDAAQAGIILLDELDAMDSNTALILNQPLASGKWSIGQRLVNNLEETVVKHKNCIILGGANTFGTGMSVQYQGRNALDGAFLDRWYCVEIGYDPILEATLGLLPVPAGLKPWQSDVSPSVEELQSLSHWYHAVRGLMEKDGLKSKIWGTRTLQKSHAARIAGVPSAEVKRDLLLGWPDDFVGKALSL